MIIIFIVICIIYFLTIRIIMRIGIIRVLKSFFLNLRKKKKLLSTSFIFATSTIFTTERCDVQNWSGAA